MCVWRAVEKHEVCLCLCQWRLRCEQVHFITPRCAVHVQVYTLAVCVNVCDVHWFCAAAAEIRLFAC